ncbi:MAG: hypothetical protein ACK4HV_05215 [Parachlamydiaceae bacterium]
MRQIRESGSLQYTFVDVSPQEFFRHNGILINSINYNKLWSAFAVLNFFKGIVQLALGILFRSQLNVFKGKRELEEGIGRIIALGDVHKGSYYIQRSLFHKFAYAHFESKKNEPFKHRELESHYFHLRDLKQNPESIINRFNLSEILEKLNKEAFLNKLTSLNDELLAKVSLYNLKNIHELLNSSLLVSDEEFAKVPIAKLVQLNFLVAERYRYFKKPQTDSVEKGSLLHILTSDDVDGLLADIPPSLYWLISNEQLEKVDFSKLDSTQLAWIFQEEVFYHRRELVKKIPNDKLEEKFLSSCPYAILFLSDDQLKYLNYVYVLIFRAIYPGIVPKNISEFNLRDTRFHLTLVQSGARMPFEELVCDISKERFESIDFEKNASWVTSLAKCPHKVHYLTKEQVLAAIKHGISFGLTAQERQVLAYRLNMTEDELKDFK